MLGDGYGDGALLLFFAPPLATPLPCDVQTSFSITFHCPYFIGAKPIAVSNGSLWRVLELQLRGATIVVAMEVASSEGSESRANRESAGNGGFCG